MKALYNSALKQSAQIRKDIDSFADSSTTGTSALQGQISASLTSFSRTVDDYAATVQRDISSTKSEKDRERIKNFRAEISDYRNRFEALKRDREEAATANARSELLGRRPHAAHTPENPYANAHIAANSTFAPSSSGTAAPGSNHYSLSFGAAPGSLNEEREGHALREQSFFQQSNAALDEYLERGRAVLDNLGDQRDMLKGTQRKLYSVATTLGVSGDTIRMVERRAKQDRVMFVAGVIGFFGFCWLVVHYLM